MAEILHAASAEMAEAAAWYAERVDGLGERFSVVYIVEPMVVIVAVAHLRRRPGYWVKRLSEV